MRTISGGQFTVDYPQSETSRNVIISDGTRKTACSVMRLHVALSNGSFMLGNVELPCHYEDRHAIVRKLAVTTR